MTISPSLPSSQMEASASSEASILSFFKRQFVTPTPIPPHINLAYKTAIISGANSGLGFETSRQLLHLGLSRLILAVRSQTRGNAAATQLQVEFPNAEIEVRLLDMDSYDSVREFAASCRREVDCALPRDDSTRRHIDFVILNAGCQATEYQVSPETKHERVFQVNYLSTMLLAILLLPILKDSYKREKVMEGKGQSDCHFPGELEGKEGGTYQAGGEDEKQKEGMGITPPVISIVTSDTAYTSTLNPDTPSIFAQLDRPPSSTRQKYDAFAQYARTKLLQQVFIPRLASYVDSDDVVVNLVNPGLCKDTAFNNGVMSGAVLGLFKVFMWMVARTLEVGASTYVDAVVVKGGRGGGGSHGSFVSDWVLKPFPPILYGEGGRRIQDQLWEETMDEFEFVGAREIVHNLKD